MQQLTIEHKNVKKDRREGKGRVLALSRNVFRLQNTSDAYYVESESGDDVYYFVKFKPDVLESWCSCKDNFTRHTIKCKHLFAIEFAIKWGTIIDIDKLPTTGIDTDQNTSNNKSTEPLVVTVTRTKSSYEDDDYTF
jgi:predicted nucleic acid-binding Zn finger protein